MSEKGCRFAARPIRVAHVMGKMANGGVEAVVMNFYRNIDREVIQFDFIVDEDSVGIPEEEIKNLGGRVFRVPSYTRLAQYREELLELFRREHWKIVHSHLNSLSVFPLSVAKRAGVPIRIAHSHSTSGKGEFARNTMKRILKSFSNIYPTHRLACSSYAGKWLFGSNVDFRILHNAIDLRRFEFNKANREEFRSAYNISNEVFVLGNVGRLVTQKNQLFLLDVFQAVRSEIPGSKLVIVGEGELKDRLYSRAQELGCAGDVILTGGVSDASKAYSAFDVFLLPSLYEGLGVVCIEAQCNGLSCIVSEQVPAEAKLTNRMYYLPLHAGISKWAQTAIRAETMRETSTFRDNDLFAVYDIRSESEKLCDYYLELVEAV